ncbi:DNA primase [Eubacteriales bacterium OttesenSCG-928-K08]|nr:DNA primase [Eubacteriales bacterium OttesenSCG-928-K08]
MARFNDAWMDTLLSKNDIESVVSSYVTLKRKGKNLWGLCPFHNEKTPSFSVAPDKQMYYCFGCGAGGGVVQFVMEMERLPFVEAVTMLAQRVGMDLPENIDDERMQKDRAKKERQYLANKLAAKFYFLQLMDKQGLDARKYFAKRGVNAQIVQQFGLGYAPEAWTALMDHLKSEGFFEEELVEAGLAVRSAKGGRVYDAFRNRVIFPIIGVNGRVLGFGARAMGDQLPKYINTSDTLVYNKRRNLYALNVVKSTRPSDIVVVEGYMDAISLHAAGITNAVASLGTSLTAQQARLIKRYAPTAYIAYDGDAAGQNATLRGLDVLQAEGLSVRVIVLPQGQDPDDFVRKHGKDAFEALRDRSLALNAFKLMRMAEQYDLSSEDGRQDFALEGCRFIASLQPVEQERYYLKLSRDTGISVEALQAQGKLLSSSGLPPENFRARANANRARLQAEDSERQLAERMLLSVLINKRESVVALENTQLDELFTVPAYLSVARSVVDAANNGKDVDFAVLLGMLEPMDAQAAAEAARMQQGEGDDNKNPVAYAQDCIRRIRKIDAAKQIAKLQAMALEQTLTIEEKIQLMQQINELKQQV